MRSGYIDKVLTIILLLLITEPVILNAREVIYPPTPEEVIDLCLFFSTRGALEYGRDSAKFFDYLVANNAEEGVGCCDGPRPIIAGYKVKGCVVENNIAKCSITIMSIGAENYYSEEKIIGGKGKEVEQEYNLVLEDGRWKILSFGIPSLSQTFSIIDYCPDILLDIRLYEALKEHQTDIQKKLENIDIRPLDKFYVNDTYKWASTPEKLISLYIYIDGNGYFDSWVHSLWIDELFSRKFLGEETIASIIKESRKFESYDSIVKKANIDKCIIKSTKAKCDVTYNIIGRYKGTTIWADKYEGKVIPEKGVVKRTFELIKENGRWKIDGPVPLPSRMELKEYWVRIIQDELSGTEYQIEQFKEFKERKESGRYVEMVDEMEKRYGVYKNKLIKVLREIEALE